jgi:hypothetical protein
MEIWKSVVGYEGHYEVSNFGIIKSIKFNKEIILKPKLSKNNYLMVNLSLNDVKKMKTVHQIVAQSFLNHLPCGFSLVVNHINHIRTDNRVENLEIVTTRENTSKRLLPSTSKYVGVCWQKSNKKWRSAIRIKGVVKFLGYHVEEIEAHYSYQNALKKLT